MTETADRSRAVNEEQLDRLENLAVMWDRAAAGGAPDGSVSWYCYALRVCARQLREVADEIRADLGLPVPYFPAEAARDA